MNLYVLNQSFQIIGYIDVFESLEWISRYYDTGEFILVTVYDERAQEILKKRNYVVREDDGQICIIEKITISTNIEEGNKITVQGKSIENILARRIIYNQTSSNSQETAESFIRRLITENAINPTDPKRKLPGLKLGSLQGFNDPISIQKTGDNLLTAIKEICQNYNYGFKITMDDNGDLVFDLYKGIDRSYQQSENPYVIFSNDFENLINAEYEYDESTYCNMALIGGEGEGTARKYNTVGNDKEGYERYELFVDAKDISTNNGEIGTAEYNQLLIERGKEKLAESSYTEVLTGETDVTRQYQYKKDFDLGDIVHVENGYQSDPRILEIAESQNEEGYKVAPTFGAWEV